MGSGASLVDQEPPVLREGGPADLCLVDLERRWIVGADGYVSKSANCAFDGHELQSKVVLTISHGSIAYADAIFSHITPDTAPTHA